MPAPTPDGPAALTGLVLAGGQSRRMGTDKAQLRLAGERLVDRALRRLAERCDQLIVASGDGRRLDVDVPQVADEAGVEGPLAGLIAGLAASPSEDVAVVAVDAPHLDVDVLDLCRRLRGGAPVSAPVVDGVPQPLHAVWARAALDELRTAASAGERSPRHLIGQLGGRLITPAAWAPVARDGAAFAVSWNHPGDLPGESEDV